MARKRRRRSRSSRRAFTTFVKRARRGGRRRRASSHGGFGGGIGKFVPAGVLPTAAGAVAGFVIAPMILDKLNIKQAASGNGRIIGKAVCGIALAFLARKAGAPRNLANALAVGGLVQAGLDVLNKSGVVKTAGLGDFADIDGPDSSPSNYGQPISGDMDGDPSMGEGDPVEQY